MDEKTTYDTSIGTNERSVRSATKLWAIVFAFIFIIGVILIVVLYSGSATETGPAGVGRPADSRNVGP